MLMLVNRAKNIVREVVARPARNGKTRRDHRSGAHARRANNAAVRASWQHENFPNRDAAMNKFPSHTCRGKGNSSKARKY